MSKKILLLVGDYGEDYEIMVPFQALQMVGHAVHAVCPGRRRAEDPHRDPRLRGRSDVQREARHDFTLNATLAEINRRIYTRW